MAKKNPDLIRIGEYEGDKEKILFRCLKHNEEHLAMPTNVKKGRGLACCKKAALEAMGRRRFETAKSEYDQRLAQMGVIERIDEYQGDGVPILHRCLIHNEEHLIRPGHALRPGRGACCRVAKRWNSTRKD